MSDTKEKVIHKVIHKTTIQVIVLSDSPYELIDLEELHHDITSGGCSGQFDITDRKELTGMSAADAINDQCSDPEFFGMNEYGENIQ